MLQNQNEHHQQKPMTSIKTQQSRIRSHQSPKKCCCSKIIQSFSPRCCRLACAHDHLLHSGLAILVALHEPRDTNGEPKEAPKFAKPKENEQLKRGDSLKPKLHNVLNLFCLNMLIDTISESGFKQWLESDVEDIGAVLFSFQAL